MRSADNVLLTCSVCIKYTSRSSDVFGKVTPVDDVETDCDQQHAEHRSAPPFLNTADVVGAHAAPIVANRHAQYYDCAPDHAGQSQPRRYFCSTLSMHDDTTQLTSNLPYPRSDANKVTNGLPESYQQNHSPTTVAGSYGTAAPARTSVPLLPPLWGWDPAKHDTHAYSPL